MKDITSFDCYEATFTFDPPVRVPSNMVIDSLGAIVVGAYAHEQPKPYVIIRDQTNADAYHYTLMACVNDWYHHDIDPLPQIAAVLHHDLGHKHAVSFVDYRQII